MEILKPPAPVTVFVRRVEAPKPGVQRWMSRALTMGVPAPLSSHDAKCKTGDGCPCLFLGAGLTT